MYLLGLQRPRLQAAQKVFFGLGHGLQTVIQSKSKLSLCLKIYNLLVLMNTILYFICGSSGEPIHKVEYTPEEIKTW